MFIFNRKKAGLCSAAEAKRKSRDVFLKDIFTKVEREIMYAVSCGRLYTRIEISNGHQDAVVKIEEHLESLGYHIERVELSVFGYDLKVSWEGGEK